jgi:hypothetical protein
MLTAFLRSRNHSLLRLVPPLLVYLQLANLLLSRDLCVEACAYRYRSLCRSYLPLSCAGLSSFDESLERITLGIFEILCALTGGVHRD